MEDFVLFFDEERLLRNKHPHWRQLMAAVRRDPNSAAEQFSRDGWTVTPSDV